MVGFTDNFQFSGAPVSGPAGQQATASANINFTDSNNYLSASGTAKLETDSGAFNYDGPFTVTEYTTGADASATVNYEFTTEDPSGNAVTFDSHGNDPNNVYNLNGTYNGIAYASSGPTPAQINQVGGLCFCSGTRIATECGETLVERLKPGDMVLSASGQRRPIVWIGRRLVEFARFGATERSKELWPYRVLAGAFGEGRPSRDLWLSPNHAVAVACLSEVLIPIKHLENGATVARVPVADVTYWHVELDSHDLLLAENMPAESFLETSGRDFFDNGADASAHRASQTRGDFCRPLFTDGPIVDAIRLQLLHRARQLGWTLTGAAEFHAAVDGIAIQPEMTDVVSFKLPPGAGDVRLVSRSFTPRHTDVATFDDRRLGVPIRAIQVTDGEGRTRDISLDDPSLLSGFQPVQTWDGDCWRWTDGDAVLQRACWAGLQGPVTLALNLASGRGSLRAWLPPGP